MGRLTMLKPRLGVADTRTCRPPPKVADEFYSSPEWRAARAECLQRAGFRCAACGRASQGLHVDHRVELSDGGHPTSQANLQALCQGCHNRKTAEARALRLGQRFDRPGAGDGRPCLPDASGGALGPPAARPRASRG